MIAPFRKPADARRQAADWFALSLSGRMTAEDHRRFDAWLAEGGNAREYRLLEQIWLAAPDFLEEQRPAAHAPARRARNSWRSIPPLAAAIAAGLMAVVVGGVGWMTLRPSPAPLPAVMETGLGERSSLTLSDDSLVELNARSRVTVDYGRAFRRVSLDAGEAYFVVAKDPARPFVVTGGGLQVTAVGTGFNVRARLNGAASVDVIEGVVRVQRAADGDASVLARAGQRVELRDGRLAVTRARTDQISGWRRGDLVFDNEPLSRVVEDLNLHSARPIVIDDATLKDRRVSGRFRTDNTSQALTALEAILGVSVSDTGESIHLGLSGNGRR